MRILLKLNYGKCSVSDLFFQKLSKKDLWGLDPPPASSTGSVNSNDALHTDGSLNSNLEYRNRFAKGLLLIGVQPN